MNHTPPQHLPPIGMPPSIELIPPARLLIDPSYQRSIENQASQAAIARIAHQWDWRLCVPLIVSRRTDGLYVIDGQHRQVGAMRRGDIPYLPCCVSDYGSAAEEAAVFITANSTPKKVHRVDQHRAALLAGDPISLAIERVVRGAGLELVATSLNGLRRGQINAMSTVATAIKRHGEDLALRTLCVIARSFPHNVLPSLGTFTAAVADLIKVDGHADDDIVRVLQGAVPFKWIERARGNHLFDQGGPGAALALRAVIKNHTGASASGTRPQPAPPPAAAAPAAAPPAEPESFEEKLARIERGEARAVPTFKPVRADHEGTLGGVGSGML